MISKEVNKTDLGREWPLTVPSGTLIRKGLSIFFERNGKRYAVNGPAGCDGGLDIMPIWRNASPCGNIKANIAPLIEMGLGLTDE